MTNVEVAIARTDPAGGRGDAVREVEALYIAAISSAQHWIYLENQYVTSPLIAKALVERLGQASGPEVVIVCPAHSGGYFDKVLMDPARNEMFRVLRDADRHGRFRAFAPLASTGVPIMIHSKVMIVDDRFLRVGSSNLNNRSLGLDTECDLAIEAAPDDRERRERIRLLLSRLVSEHVVSCTETFTAELSKSRSLVSTIDALNPRNGRRLELFPAQQLSRLDRFMGWTHLFDPMDLTDNWRPWRRIRGAGNS